LLLKGVGRKRDFVVVKRRRLDLLVGERLAFLCQRTRRATTHRKEIREAMIFRLKYNKVSAVNIAKNTYHRTIACAYEIPFDHS